MAKQVRNVPQGTSQGGGGTATAPSSGTAFASVTPAEAGYYRVTFIWQLSGTAETTLTNIRIKSMGANLLSALPTGGGSLVSLTVDKIQADGVNPISLCSNSAPTAGAVYTGAVIATRIE